MNGQHAPTAITESRERESYARLRGRWIVLGRGTWITQVVLSLGIFFASFPVYLAQLHTLCAGTACSYWQLTSEQAEVLSGVGWSLDDYAAFVIALTLASGVLYLVLSMLTSSGADPTTAWHCWWHSCSCRLPRRLRLTSCRRRGTRSGRCPQGPDLLVAGFARARLLAVSLGTVRAALDALDPAGVSRRARSVHGLPSKHATASAWLAPGSQRGGHPGGDPTLPLSLGVSSP